MPWDKAWSIVTRTFAYTNHTLLPEALEKWSVGLFQKVLPRHLQIIFEINKRFLEHVEAKWPGDSARKRTSPSSRRAPCRWCAWPTSPSSAATRSMASPRCTPSLLKNDLFPEFDELYPGKFNNKTNGITPRRWLLACNPRLSELITSKIGHGWERDLDKLRGLEAFADDPQFQSDFMAVKQRQQGRPRPHHQERLRGVEVNPAALFDVQIKRLHEYKRQHLNLLHILALYRRLLAEPRPRRSRRASSSSPPRPRPVTTWPSASSRPSTPSAQAHQQRHAHQRTSSRSSSCPTTASRSPSASSRPPISPSKSPPPARKPPAPAT